MGAPYHRWSAAAGAHIAKTSGTDFVNSGAGRGTMLRNYTAPRVPCTRKGTQSLGRIGKQNPYGRAAEEIRRARRARKNMS